jgi:uncharacterized protein
MRLHTCKNAQSFLKTNQSLLVKNESLTQLIIYNALQNLTAVPSTTCLFGTITEDKQVILLFSNVNPYNIQLFTPIKDERLIYNAIKLLIEYIFQSNIPIKGINGNKVICQNFIACYTDKLPSSMFKELLRSDILVLRRFHSINNPSGTFRQATLSDLDTITHWNVLFGKDALGLSLEYDRIINLVKEQINKNLYYLFLNSHNIPVSMACTTRQLLNGVSISYVYTSNNYRNMGYATAIMYYLGKYILEHGNQFCTLFVDKKNPIANRVYQNIGYEVIDENYDYHLF